MGRLGNQMFQFASVLGIADKLGLEARFPLENCFRFQGSGPFDPTLGRNMSVKCDLLDCFDIDPKYFIPERHLVFDKVYNESEFGYNLESEKIQDGTVLYGYYQTEKYFFHMRENILKEFSFKEKILNTSQAYISYLKKICGESKLVSLHVRRGDYVRFPDHHPVCSMEYYQEAKSKIIEHVGKDCKFVIFSDDIEWCMSEFKGEEYIICNIGAFDSLSDNIKENLPYIELCVMSLCDHHIIANSSFSWWGAWLNVKQDKTVVAPSRWFGPAMNKNTEDVYSQNWIKI